MLIPAIVLVGDQTLTDTLDTSQLFLWAETIRAAFDHAGLNLLKEASHTYFKEFIQVGANEGEKLHTFQERIIRRLGLFQHAPIKGQPAQLAVEIGESGSVV